MTLLKHKIPADQMPTDCGSYPQNWHEPEDDIADDKKGKRQWLGDLTVSLILLIAAIYGIYKLLN